MAEPPNASVSNGCIQESYGRPLCLLLDTLRFLAAKDFVRDENVRSLQDIERLHRGGRGRTRHHQQQYSSITTQTTATPTRVNYFLAVAWSHWNDPGDVSVYELSKKWTTEWLKELQRRPIPVHPREAKEFVRYREIVAFSRASFDHVRAVKSWHVRIHGDFWVVGGDANGTFLIPQKNEDMVYQCVGLTKSLHDIIEDKYGNKPMVWKVTLIPFYGRLVYDGVVTLGGGAAASQGLAMVANDSKTRRLNATVEEAKRNKRVVRRLLQLEVEGGSLHGLPRYGPVDKSSIPTVQPPPTPLEMKLLRSYMSIPNSYSNEDPSGAWVFRRKGYTEHENPDRVGLILGGGEAMGFFHCSDGLQPTSIDILSGVLEAAIVVGCRPYVLMPDDYACYLRLHHLFAQVMMTDDNRSMTRIDYYHPPTPEETAAAILTTDAERTDAGGGMSAPPISGGVIQMEA